MTETSRPERLVLTGIFVLALLYSLSGIGYHWTMGFLAGHEFRQAQTAIVSHYIDQQNNFSLLYETPILGKPWVSILLEVPVYEWSVVLLSRATGLPHFIAARIISAGCFYAMLPAVYLLLGRLGLPPPRRLLVLALILAAPVYIFYSRAFLIDSMALGASVWFLLGFVRTMDERRWPWLVLTILTGTLAALIKSAIFAVWLVPAAGYGAWMLGRDLRAGGGWGRPLRTVLWGAATVVVALGSLCAWIAYTDPIKAAHASAWIFTSKNLSQGNWGLFDLSSLFSGELWRLLTHCWGQAIMSPWLILPGLAAGLALPAVRGRVLLTGGLFFAAQLLFPWAYAYQDYYFYSCAVFVLAALGYTLVGLLDSRVPRWIVVLACAAPFAAQVAAYWQDYRQVQAIRHHGGYPFTDVLRELTPKRSVLVVAGADWAAMIPLYAQRKALMIRNGLEHDRAYLERAFNDLAGEDIAALVLVDKLRPNRSFLEYAAARLDIDPRTPTFSWTTADVYVARPYAKAVQLRLKSTQRFPGITMPPEAYTEIRQRGYVEFTPEVSANVFGQLVHPNPDQADFQFGLDWIEHEGRAVLSVHPNADLWLVPPPGATAIHWSFGIFDGAFENPEAATDGVEFIVRGELANGETRVIYHRLLDPARRPGDRGAQHEVIPYQPVRGERLRFSTQPNEHSAFDWAYTIEIRVK